MTDPNENDSWADLYSDLGIDVPPAPPKPEPIEEIQLVTAPEDAEGEPDDEFAGGLEEGDEGEADGEGESEAEGEPGQKKRRRRRRRRKKRGDGAPEAATETAEAEPEATEAPEEEAFEEEGVEGATPEATREIISNWNVPSWQEIVAGLYRPDR